MNRRDLLMLISGAAVAVPVVALAQQSEQKARVGYLSPGPRERADPRESGAFFDELAHYGYEEGRNLEVLFEVFGEAPDRLPQFVAALIGARVHVMVAQGPEAAVRAARDATDAMPVVVVAINYDPVERGYAANLAHPGGNVTGVFFQSLDLAGKQVELLKAITPAATRLGVVWGAETKDEFTAAESAARALGLATLSFELGAPPYDYDDVFRRVAEDAPQLVLVLSTPAFAGHHGEAATAALRYRLPAIFRFRTYVEAGGLMSYGVDSPAMSRIAARYVAKILGGAKPAELPVERADRFDLVINLRTAKALGLTVPPFLLARADEVIE